MRTPPQSRPPLVGITADAIAGPSHGGEPADEPALFLPGRYCRAVQEAGGVPVILPITPSRAVIRALLVRLDGLLVSGGNFDISPEHYGEKPRPGLRGVKEERTDFELELTTLALRQDLPILGICGGAQAINVALGGSLYQDIGSELPHALAHEQGQRKETGGHRIRIHAGTRLQQIVKRRFMEVNTTHHQAVKKPGKGLVVNATSEDGLIEGIESPSRPFVLGVQWHPEVLSRTNAIQRKIFASLVSFCGRRRRGK